MLSGLSFIVGPAEAGLRLDCVIAARYPAVPRSRVREAILAGAVRVNGRPCLKSDKAPAGATVAIESLPEGSDMRVEPDPSVPLDVLYEDADLLAFNKPAGRPVHPNARGERGTLMNGAVARYPELASIGDRPLMAGALHRIDTNTSGLVLAARTPAAFATLREEFTRQSVTKIYLALVEGRVEKPGRVEGDLAHDPKFRGHILPASAVAHPDRLLHARTDFRVKQALGDYTLLEVTILTGVTHQIRCQLAAAGHPIVNDVLYGARPVPGCPRHFLHAASATFRHPSTGAALTLAAPLTPDFQKFLDDLIGR